MRFSPLFAGCYYRSLILYNTFYLAETFYEEKRRVDRDMGPKPMGDPENSCMFGDNCRDFARGFCQKLHPPHPAFVPPQFLQCPLGERCKFQKTGQCLYKHSFLERGRNAPPMAYDGGQRKRSRSISPPNARDGRPRDDRRPGAMDPRGMEQQYGSFPRDGGVKRVRGVMDPRNGSSPVPFQDDPEGVGNFLRLL